MFCTPCLFFLTGFTQGFSWLQTDSEKQFTIGNILSFYFKRIVRFWPFVFISFLLAIFIIPHKGNGPNWSNYSTQVIDGCDKYWWTTFAYANNILPVNSTYDEKCLPWTWFIPVYVQLSLLLPFLMLIMSKLNVLSWNAVRGFMFFLMIGLWTFVYIVCFTENVGSSPITILPINDGNDVNKTFYISFAFYNQIYMKPWFWVSIYTFGIFVSFGYNEYLRQLREGLGDRNAFKGSAVIYNALNQRLLFRALTYTVAIFCLLYVFFRQWKFVTRP